jgi:hypothetical protein
MQAGVAKADGKEALPYGIRRRSILVSSGKKPLSCPKFPVPNEGRRTVVVAMQSSTQPNPSAPFNAWQRATAALRAAEHRGAAHPEIVQLAEQVIRTRNALVLDRLAAGWQPPDDILQQLISDEELLRERDDCTHSDTPASTA